MTKRASLNGAMTEAEVAARDAARGFTDADMAEVMDNPAWTDEELRNAKPFAEVFPDMAAAMRRGLNRKKT